MFELDAAIELEEIALPAYNLNHDPSLPFIVSLQLIVRILQDL